MRGSKNYILAYGINNELHWFLMKVAISRVFSIGKVLTEENIEHFIPTNDEIISNIDGHKIVQVPMADLIFIYSSKAKIEHLKATNQYSHSLCFITEIPHSELKIGMTELEMRQFNRIIIVDDLSIKNILDNINKIRSKVTLLQYSETFSHIGKCVRIIEGPLTGTEGVLLRVKGNKHIHIDLDNLPTAQIDYILGYIYIS